jgi:methylated-DNA-[protein]-cysteine S-methyltransferase
MNLSYDEVDSPLGRIRLVARDGALCALGFDEEQQIGRRLQSRYGDVRLDRVSNPSGFSARVRDYLRGDLDALVGIPTDSGGTAFQRRVWQRLGEVGAGKTVSYGELAAAIGRPTASRAVGLANARNPVALVVPCHRVIGADGSLTGYAGGLERKRWLLRHEGVAV